MIITPKCQLFLDMENKVIDKGHAGLTWTPQGNGAKYADGKFGRTYEFESPSNNLQAGSQINPLNVSQSFTVGGWYKRNEDGGLILDFGLRFDSSSNNNNSGYAIQIEGTGIILLKVQSSVVGFNGGSRGRWVTDYATPFGEWCFICHVRVDNSKSYFYAFDPDGWFTNEVDHSLPIVWANRLWGIGIGWVNASQAIQWQFTDSHLNKLGFWNTALDFGDVQRIMMGLHPLNG